MYFQTRPWSKQRKLRFTRMLFLTFIAGSSISWIVQYVIH